MNDFLWESPVINCFVTFSVISTVVNWRAINSSKPNTIYMRKEMSSSMSQTILSHMFGDKPLSEPMLCCNDPKAKVLGKVLDGYEKEGDRFKRRNIHFGCVCFQSELCQIFSDLEPYTGFSVQWLQFCMWVFSCPQCKSDPYLGVFRLIIHRSQSTATGRHYNLTKVRRTHG